MRLQCLLAQNALAPLPSKMSRRDRTISSACVKHAEYQFECARRLVAVAEVAPFLTYLGIAMRSNQHATEAETQQAT
jgi:hypothetical protein